jgi:hypothetical protein
MTRILILVILLFAFGTSHAQKCNCYREFQFVTGKIEHTLPSYQDQVLLQHREAAYKLHKEQCNIMAKAITDSSQCIYLVGKYLSFFRDEHLSVEYKESIYTWDEDDADAERKFYAKERKYKLPKTTWPGTGPEGFWRTKDNKMIVKVVKDVSPLWDYVGLVVQANKQYWTPGQIKFSLKKIDNNRYECIFLSGSRKPRVAITEYKDSLLTIGRLTEFQRIANPDTLPVAVKSSLPGNEFEFRELSAQTNYLRISDFSYDMYKLIDSIVLANFDKLISKPNLIIDVRDNGGGGERSFQSMLPFIMSSKTVADPIASSIYASPDIQKFYKENIYKYCGNREDTVSADSLLDQIAMHINSFLPAKFEDRTLDTIHSKPQNVAIIMNRWCASSTESFILTAMQSDKVLLCGENTWGMCTYGELIPIDLPCLPVTMSVPSKKMYMRNGADYESIGIIPELRLNGRPENEWLSLVLQRLEHK